MKRQLTVEELIEILQSMPQETPVMVPKNDSLSVTFVRSVYFSEEYESVIIE